jgi:hypothetical protein
MATLRDQREVEGVGVTFALVLEAVLVPPCHGYLARPASLCGGAVVVVQSAEDGDRDDRAGERA